MCCHAGAQYVITHMRQVRDEGRQQSLTRWKSESFYCQIIEPCLFKLRTQAVLKPRETPVMLQQYERQHFIGWRQSGPVWRLYSSENNISHGVRDTKQTVYIHTLQIFASCMYTFLYIYFFLYFLYFSLIFSCLLLFTALYLHLLFCLIDAYPHFLHVAAVTTQLSCCWTDKG